MSDRPAMAAAERGGALPQFFEFEAPAGWRAIEFVSDLHLQASQPQTLAAFAAYLRATDADAVFLLGDVFEAWVGDDARHDGFERQVLELLQEAAARIALGFMAGNRDFLVGTAMLRDAGLTALPDPTVLRAFGERLLLTHGDALCTDDRDYQRFRAEVRTPEWQARFLALPLAERRALAARMRDASQAHQRMQPATDIDTALAVQWMHEAGAPVLVHGHTHRPGTEALAPGHARWVLSDWDLGATPPRAEVLRLSPRGLARHRPAPSA